MDVKPEKQRQWQTYLDFIEDCSFLTHSPDTNLASHHIIPRHLGGTDDADNLIDLTYWDHAQAHRLLYETFGLAHDKRAWKSWEVAAQDEQSFLDGCIKGGQIGGLATVESHGPQLANGGKATIESHGPQLANGGKATIESHGPQLANGGKATIESHGLQLANGGKAGGKATIESHGPQLANGGKATIESHGPQLANGGRKAVDSGQLASLHAKWISLYDGHICPRNWISRRNKEDQNRIGTWVEL